MYTTSVVAILSIRSVFLDTLLTQRTNRNIMLTTTMGDGFPRMVVEVWFLELGG